MNSMISPHDYVLGELTLDELVEAERLMRDDPSFRAEVRRLRAVTGRIERLPAEAWDPAEPPPLALDLPEPAPRRRVLPRLSLRAGLAAAAAACMLIAIGVGAGLLLSSDDGVPDQARTIALDPVARSVPAAASGTATLDQNEVRLRLTGLPASQRGRFYEVWLLNSPNDLVSLGGFRVSESGEAEFSAPLPVQGSSFSYVDLSLEPADGNPAHSGKSVLRGAIN